MLNDIFKSPKKTTQITEFEVRNEIAQRVLINAEARRMAIKIANSPESVAPAKVSKVKENPHAATLAKLDQILDKVSGFDNCKISALAELYNALESGNTKNLIEFLKTDDRKKIVKNIKVTVTK